MDAEPVIGFEVGASKTNINVWKGTLAKELPKGFSGRVRTSDFKEMVCGEAVTAVFPYACDFFNTMTGLSVTCPHVSVAISTVEAKRRAQAWAKKGPESFKAGGALADLGAWSDGGHCGMQHWTERLSLAGSPAVTIQIGAKMTSVTVEPNFADKIGSVLPSIAGTYKSRLFKKEVCKGSLKKAFPS